MSNRKRVQSRVRVAVILALLWPAAGNAAQRTFVSAGSGSDANPCTRPAPCRNFGAAMAQTDPGGEVIVLDSGGYGTVTINQSVSITAPAGVYAGITAFSGNGITIHPDLLVSAVYLRGLTLNALGGVNGVDYNLGVTMGGTNSRIFIDNFTVTGFANNGMNLSRNARYAVSHSILRQNGGSGIYLSGNDGAPSHASIRGVVLEGNLHGIVVDNAQVGVWDSVATSHGSGNGFEARAGMMGQQAWLSLENCQATSNLNGFAAGNASGTARMYVSSSVASMNGNAGIRSASNGTVRVARNNVTANLVGFEQVGSGVFESRGDNNIRGNDTDESGTITLYPE